MDAASRSYFDIPTGQLQLFGEEFVVAISKSSARSPVTRYLSLHLFQKITATLSYMDWRIERKQMTLFQRAHSNWPPSTGSFFLILTKSSRNWRYRKAWLSRRPAGSDSNM
jgi:hypothetical protein